MERQWREEKTLALDWACGAALCEIWGDLTCANAVESESGWANNEPARMAARMIVRRNKKTLLQNDWRIRLKGKIGKSDSGYFVTCRSNVDSGASSQFICLQF
jgi:hypothetical protein